MPHAFPPRTRLAEILRAEGIRQEDLAADIGVSQSAVSLWVTGKRAPGHHNMGKVAHRLGRSVDEVFFSPMRTSSDARRTAEGVRA